MSTRVKLTIMDGDLKEKELQCDGYTRCLIGRAEDCDVQLPTDFLHADISRHHCVLEVEPPHVWVRDLGTNPRKEAAILNARIRKRRLSVLNGNWKTAIRSAWEPCFSI